MAILAISYDLRWAITLLSVTVLGACSGGGADPRIATPAATVETLLRAYNMLGVMTPNPARAWSEGGAEVALPPDLDAVALCVWDYDRDDPDSRAMAEFVTGMLAAGQRDLRYDIGPERGVVRSGSRPVHLRRTPRGWQIVMRESIPREIRQGLLRGKRLRGGSGGDVP